MKKGLVFVSVLLVLSLGLNIFQCIDRKNRTGCVERFQLYLSDSVFIDRTVEVYDAFVRSHMGDELPIGEAYKRFFIEGFDKMIAAGDTEMFMPDSTFVYQWTADLVGGMKLQNTLFKPYYLTPMGGSPEWPSRWHLNMEYLRMVDFGSMVCRQNPAWNDWLDHTMAVGDIWVINIRPIISKIDFDNPNERFLAVIGFMNGCFDHRDFNLVKDVRRNDSLKIAWNNYDWEIE